MLRSELDSYLWQITPSEQRHLDHPHELSERYKRIPKVEHDGQMVYSFRYHSVLSDKDVWLMKESRYAEILPHVHEVIEISYVYHGSCVQIIDGRRQQLAQGDLILFDLNTVHSVEALGADDIVIRIAISLNYLIDELLKRLAQREMVTSFLAQTVMRNIRRNRHIIFHGAADPELHLTMQQLICEYLDEHASMEVVNAYMVILFSHLMRIYNDNQGEDVATERDPFLNILQFIDKNPQVKLNELARRFGYSEAYLGSLIKQKTGSGFRELIQAKRMRDAEFWLATTDVPVYEIAESIGYKNLGFFYRKFQEHAGCTPQAYRDAHRPGDTPAR